ncbi:MAG: hypothetical protein LH702_35335, partial [Phormidesmis sp. CAN_BIN44]|nr:hypothetical protein [Phormidesmis sp. CAN_BIN44]
QQRALTGCGLRNFTQLYDAQMHYWLGHPHNVLLMMSAEAGIPAALLLYGLVGWVMAQGVLALREMNSDRLIYFTFLMAFAACTLFSFLDITLFDARINTMGWVLLAGIWGVASRTVQDERKQVVSINATDQS